MRTRDGNGGKQMMVTRLKPTFLSDPYRSDSGMLKLLAGTQDIRVMKMHPTSVVLIHSVPRFAAVLEDQGMASAAFWVGSGTSDFQCYSGIQYVIFNVIYVRSSCSLLNEEKHFVGVLDENPTMPQ